METEVRRAEDVEHLERHISLQFRGIHGVTEPRAIKGATTERVAAFVGKAVPIGDGKAQVVFHPFAHDDFVGVVVTECKFVFSLGAFVFDGLNAFEKIGHRNL